MLCFEQDGWAGYARNYQGQNSSLNNNINQTITFIASITIHATKPCGIIIYVYIFSVTTLLNYKNNELFEKLLNAIPAI